jgi:peptidyl-prolyl cis-trans isomerase C
MPDTWEENFTRQSLRSGTGEVSNRTENFELPTNLLSSGKMHLYYMAPQARASHILVKTEDEANKILKRLADGEEFDKLARRFSSCPSGKQGGDLGWFGRGMMVPEFEQIAFSEEVGKVVGPVKTQFGYHVIKVTGKK